MKLAPPSSMALGLMSLALLGSGCDSGPTPEQKAQDAAAAKAAMEQAVKAEKVATEKAGGEHAAAAAEHAVTDKAADDKAAADKTAEPAPTLAAVAPPTPGAPGPAYFAVDKLGVVRLDGGKFTVLADSPTSLVKGLQIGGDGRVWVADSRGLMRLEGDTFKKAITADYGALGGSIDQFAVLADGQVWATTYTNVFHHDGKAWSTEEKATIGAGDDPLKSIAVDAAGKVWVTSIHKVHVRDGGAWKTIDLGKAGRGTLFFYDIALGPEGSVYALHTAALLQIGPALDKVEKVKLGRSSMTYRSLSQSTNLGLAVVDIDAVSVVPTGGAPRTYSPRDSKFLKSARFDAVATDDSGRVWASTEAGVVILGPGDAKTEWLAGSMPELSGEIRSILVVGSGPTELPGAGAVRKGGLTGKLLRDGSPLANAAVELCPSPSFIYSKTPCADGAVKFSTKSDDSGVWTVPEVPLGTYGIAVKTDGKWQITMGSRMGDGMKEGQVYDTGSLTLDKK